MDVLGKVGLEQNIEKTLNNMFETTRKEIEKLSVNHANLYQVNRSKIMGGMLSLFPYRTKPAFLSIELILPNMVERKVTCTVMSYEIPGFPMVLSSLGAEFSGKIPKDFPGVSTVISHNCQGTISKEPKLKLFFENATKNMFGTSLKIRPNTSLDPLTTFPILVTVDNFIILEPKYKYIASPIGWIPVSHEMNSDIVNCIKNGNVGTTLRLLKTTRNY